MLRRNDLEYPWIFKASFYVSAYTAKLENGKTLVVYAHDFNDMEFFLTRLEVKESPIAMRFTDSDYVKKRRILSYLPDKDGEPKKKPFWYRGRVYELQERGNKC